MSKLLVTKIIESVEVSCGKVKVFLRDVATHLTWGNIVLRSSLLCLFVVTPSLPRDGGTA